MNENTGSKNVLAEIINRWPLPSPYPISRYRRVIIFFIGAMTPYVIAGLCALLFLYAPWPEPRWGWYAFGGLLSLVVAQVMAFLYIIVGFIRSLVPMLMHYERTVFKREIDYFPAERSFISELAHIYEGRDLEYARDALALAVEHTRSRIAIMAGALDKVGIIPLAITIYFSVHKWFADSRVSQFELEYAPFIGGGIAFLYLSGAYSLGCLQRGERLCLLLKHAVEEKKSLESAPSDDASHPQLVEKLPA